MPVIRIHDLDDPRVEPFRRLKQTNATRDPQWVIAEGLFLTQRLLESGLQIHGVLISHRRYSNIEHEIPNEVDVLLVSDDLVEQLVGFDFHAGVIGCGVRPQRLEQPLDVSRFNQAPDSASKQLVVACPFTVLPENLGAIIRLSAGLGASGILIGSRSVDPFLRRTVRVSMGSVFQLPISLPKDFRSEVLRLRHEFGFQILATSMNRESTNLSAFKPPQRCILLLGNEADGLADEWFTLADQCLTIPMSGKVDSLNVANAAAIFLHHLLR